MDPKKFEEQYDIIVENSIGGDVPKCEIGEFNICSACSHMVPISHELISVDNEYHVGLCCEDCYEIFVLK